MVARMRCTSEPILFFLKEAKCTTNADAYLYPLFNSMRVHVGFPTE